MKIMAIILKKERIKNKMTLQEMADELGIPLRAYRNYESLATNHRVPPLETIIKISEILGVTVGYLFGKE